jgi:outer membrane lipoprotein-sorting protein
MKSIIVISLLLLLTSFNSYSQVDDKQAQAILDKVAAKLKTYQNMKYEFSYRMIDKAHKVDNKLQGTIVMKGEMYNLNIMGRNVVNDGKTVWTYDADAQEIQISHAADSKEGFSFLKLLTSMNKDHKAKLIKTVKEGNVEFYIVDITPIKGKSYFKVRLKINKAKLWVDSATIYEKNNVEYEFTVIKFTTNLTLPATYFQLNPAKFPDAEVVDLR